MKISSFSQFSIDPSAQRPGERSSERVARRRDSAQETSEGAEQISRRLAASESAPPTYDRRRRLSGSDEVPPSTQADTTTKLKGEEKKNLFGDLDGNSTIDGADLGILLGKFGTNDEGGDLDKNGIVDGSDLKLLNEAFERATKQGAAAKEAKPEGKFGDLDGNSVIDGADLAALLGKFGTDDASGDLDGSGAVDESDLKLLNEAWKRASGN